MRKASTLFAVVFMTNHYKLGTHSGKKRFLDWSETLTQTASECLTSTSPRKNIKLQKDIKV